jgi:putative transposase
MPRRHRYGLAGHVLHVMNRGARRGLIFESPAQYDSFVAVLVEALEHHPIRLLSFCAMPTHFHLLVWPETNSQTPNFMHWLTATHALRWRKANDTVGQGAVYQGRYKAIPVQTDDHFATVARYVERNALRAGLVKRAEDWRWCSLWHRHVARDDFPLAAWPIACPDGWLAHVNRPQTIDEVASIRRSINRSCAYGNPSWQEEIAKTLGHSSSLRLRGRPGRNSS